MAISDYAHMAFDQNANPIEGTIYNGDASVEIYKNWLYVHDANMWHKGCGYSEDTIAQIQEGRVYLSGFDILAKSIELQSAIFTFVTYTHYPDPKDYSNPEFRWMAGIGCSGFDSRTEKLCKHFNINPDDYEYISKGWSNFNDETGKFGETMILHAYCKGKNGKIKSFYLPETKANLKKFDTVWVGITAPLYKEFIKWLGTVIEPHNKYHVEWYKKMKKIKLSDVEFYNQGDKFFMENGIGNGDIAQTITATKTPVIMDMIKNM